mmetsp:Transcript_39408/g.93290  ORF Transcript_39408/g.93290 Transcript_39408/m.93290 type:complete len:402 (+) Transcript_39408:146-1351(+)
MGSAKVGDKRARQGGGAKGPSPKIAKTESPTQQVEKLRRIGNPADVQAQARVCFLWAANEWYLGTVLSSSPTKQWWNVEWDDNTKNQIRLAEQNKTNWWIVKSDAEDTKLREILEDSDDDIEEQDDDEDEDEDAEDDDELDDNFKKQVETDRSSKRGAPDPKQTLLNFGGAGAKASKLGDTPKSEEKPETRKSTPLAAMNGVGVKASHGKDGKAEAKDGKEGKGQEKVVEPVRPGAKKEQPLPKNAPEQALSKNAPEQSIAKKAPELAKKAPELAKKAPEQPVATKTDKHPKPATHAFAAAGVSAGAGASASINAPASSPSPEQSPPREETRSRARGEPVTLHELADEVSTLKEVVASIRKEVRVVQRMLEKSERGLLTKLTICADLLRENSKDRDSAGAS